MTDPTTALGTIATYTNDIVTYVPANPGWSAMGAIAGAALAGWLGTEIDVESFGQNYQRALIIGGAALGVVTMAEVNRMFTDPIQFATDHPILAIPGAVIAAPVLGWGAWLLGAGFLGPAALVAVPAGLLFYAIDPVDAVKAKDAVESSGAAAVEWVQGVFGAGPKFSPENQKFAQAEIQKILYPATPTPGGFLDKQIKGIAQT